MLEVIVLFVLGAAWILFASVQDLRKREVANWLSFSLIVFALGFRFFYSLFNGGNFWFFAYGLIGLLIFFILGNVFYYARVFAGGDAKLMIALGPILPLTTNFLVNLKIFGVFIFLFFLSGAVYGLIATIVLSFRDFKAFRKNFSERFRKNKVRNYLFAVLGLILMLLGFFEGILFVLGILIFIFPGLFLYAKTVDSVSMVKEIKTSELTEGDWLYKRVKVGRKTIMPSWEGLSKEDIKLIRKKYKKVKVKQGIAFVPVFLISFLIFIYSWFTGLWNVFF
jgi:Flp pilus assembly protein protease CpaA